MPTLLPTPIVAILYIGPAGRQLNIIIILLLAYVRRRALTFSSMSWFI